MQSSSNIVMLIAKQYQLAVKVVGKQKIEIKGDWRLEDGETGRQILLHTSYSLLLT